MMTCAMSATGKLPRGSGAVSADQQRQLACLTTNNTALLAELVELQVLLPAANLWHQFQVPKHLHIHPYPT